MKHKPLDDLEMFELICAAYPERFTGDEDESFNDVSEFVDEIEGFDDVSELLGRVVMLTMPMRSELTDRYSHCLGEVTIKNGTAQMIAAVRRSVKTDS